MSGAASVLEFESVNAGRMVTYGNGGPSRVRSMRKALVQVPRPAHSSAIARLGLLADPAEVTSTPDAAATSTWIRRRRDLRFGLPTDAASEILEKITAETGRTDMPRVLVVVAHPDDEAIGAGAVMRGIPDVTVVHVTDGAPNDVDYARRRGFETREAYAKARRDEVVTALSIIGISEERVRGLGYVDGEASWHLVDLCHKVADLFEELQPEVVLTHPYEGGHSDHDSTAFAVHLAAGILRREGMPAPVVLEMTSYHNYDGQRRLFEFLPYEGMATKTVSLSSEAREVKKQMFDAFTSQAELLRTIPVELERFRQAPRYLFTVPPHEGQLDYERLCRRLTGDEWRAQADRALQALRSKTLFRSA